MITEERIQAEVAAEIRRDVLVLRNSMVYNKVITS